MKKLLAASLVLAGLLVLVSSAFAAPQATVGSIPFKGTLREASETHEIVMPYMNVNGKGSGEATLLGQFKYSYQAKVHLPDKVSQGVSAQFTAANGDEIYAQGSGVGAPSGTPNVNLVSENFTITGGTGRFAGATGSLVMKRKVNTTTLESSGTFEGDITFP